VGTVPATGVVEPGTAGLEAGAGTPAVDGAASQDTSSGGPGEAPVVEHVPIKKKGSRKR
jgi:ribonuclease E